MSAHRVIHTMNSPITIKEHLEQTQLRYISMITHLRSQHSLTLPEIEILYTQFMEDRTYLDELYVLQFRNELSRLLKGLGYENSRFVNGKIYLL